MPFEIVRNDIVRMRVDAIVNPANPRPMIGGGTDRAIHTAAGPRLLKARQKVGSIPMGGSAITPGFDLDASYVIHTVGPIWQGGAHQEATWLRRSYHSALALARKHGCRSIAFPLISAGTYGFPKDLALDIALQAFREFLQEHEMEIYLVVFNREAFQLSERLMSGVASYIDEHYVQKKLRIEYAGRASRQMACYEVEEAAVSLSLDEMLAHTDAGFTETLLKLIDQTGEKDSTIYKRANISKQHFSKIRNNPFYTPTKATALALAIALKLDLADTKDLIGRAGYALSNSSKFDIIVRYFIEQRNYNLFDINAALFEFDQPLLGM